MLKVNLQSTGRHSAVGTARDAGQGQRGFTLVELAIVLVIIGLVIAGVLKGQELITNARLKSTTADVEAMRGAVNTFRDKYGALPGDYAQAQARIGDAAGVNWDGAGDGNGDGIVDGDGITGETMRFWNHLAAADMVKGISPLGDATIGDGLPAASIGGGFTVAHEAVVGRTSHWMRLGSAAATPAGVVDSNQAEDVDTKIDDGRPGTGTTRMTTVSCVDSPGTATSVEATHAYSGAVQSNCLMNFEL